MKRFSLSAAFVCWALLVPLAGHAQPDVPELIRQLTGQVEAPERTPEQLQVAYRTVIAQLAEGLSSTEPGPRTEARRQLESLVLPAAAPGREVHRRAAALALMDVLATRRDQMSRRWLLKEVGNVGGPEVLPGLAELLNDADPVIVEAVYLAAQNIPSPQLDQGIVAGLMMAPSDEMRVAMINALGFRRVTGAVSALRPLLTHANEEVAEAAAAALGNIGTADAATALVEAYRAAGGARALALADAALDAADRLRETGQIDAARPVYTALNAPTAGAGLRMAATRGLALSGGEAGVNAVLTWLRSDNPRDQAFGAGLVADVPGADATRAFAGQLDDLPDSGKLALVRALGQRGDAAARHAIEPLARAGDETLRLAALESLGQLGDARSLPLLLELSDGEGPVAEAAYRSLLRLHGGNVDDQLFDRLRAATGAEAQRLAEALVARRTPGSGQRLLQIAEQHPTAEVRAAALRGLSRAADPALYPQVVNRLAAAQTDPEREAALEAARSLMAEVAPEGRAEPVLGALGTAAAANRLLVLRLLAQTGSPAALTELQRALTGDDRAARLAVLQGLRDWPGTGPVDDVLTVARDARDAEVAAAAVAAAESLLSADPTRTAEARAAIYGEFLGAGRDAQVRARAIEALGRTPSLTAMQALQPLLPNAELSDTVPNALVQVARAIAASYPAEALAVLQQVREASDNPEVQDYATQGIERIQGWGGRVTAWQMAGPYSGGNLFDDAFEPETAPDQTTWRLVPGDAVQGEGMVNFLATPIGGQDRVAYLRTYLYSPTEQPARLSLGSDDGVKVWLNGEVVFQLNAARGHGYDSDTVDVTLRQGWNPLLLKVTQGGGDWSASLRVLDRNGQPLPNVRARVAPDEAPGG